MMYKKASRLKLRVQTSRGMLTVEQLWDLKLSDLAVTVKSAYEEKKKFEEPTEDLAFLERPVTGEAELAELRFNIVKDIFLTKQGESKDAIEKMEKKKEANRIAEILQRKKDAALESLSVEELEKKLKEVME